MDKGQVKWFNNAKGIGFIRPADGGEDVFVHYSVISMEGYKTVAANQDVTYELKSGPKGNFAATVVLE